MNTLADRIATKLARELGYPMSVAAQHGQQWARIAAEHGWSDSLTEQAAVTLAQIGPLNIEPILRRSHADIIDRVNARLDDRWEQFRDGEWRLTYTGPTHGKYRVFDGWWKPTEQPSTNRPDGQEERGHCHA